MNAFPIFAAFTVAVSFVVLRASFQELSEAPLALDASAEADLLRAERDAARPARRPDFGIDDVGGGAAPGVVLADASHRGFAPRAGADDGLLDHELASVDPINAWLERYLTPPAE